MAKRKRKSRDPFGDLTDTLKFGTTALVGVNVLNTIASKIKI